MKLDCEGAEYPILSSADSKDLGRVRQIAMEYHKGDVASLLARLTSEGFVILHYHTSHGGGHLFACR